MFIGSELTPEARRGMITETNLIVRRWEQSRLLDGTEGDFKTSLAVCLETQRITDCHKPDTPDHIEFKRLSAPLIIRIFKASEVCRSGKFVVDRSRVDYKSHYFATKWCPPKKNKWRQYSLDDEAVYLADFALCVAKEIDHLFQHDRPLKENERVAFDCFAKELYTHGDGRLAQGKNFVMSYEIMDWPETTAEPLV